MSILIDCHASPSEGHILSFEPSTRSREGTLESGKTREYC